MDDLLRYTRDYGPWVALMLYYFVFLNGQLKEIIFNLQEQRRLLEILVGLRHKE